MYVGTCFYVLRTTMASAAVNQMWIFETAVNVKMVTMIYRILISMAVNVSKAFHRVTKK